ncbi:MAG: metallopeptidase family protein [candidate division FCPU426 bacterium]
MRVSRQQLAAVIRKALDRLPAVFRRRLNNVGFVLEEDPGPEVRKSLRLRADEDLLGLYQGVPQSQRGLEYGQVLPDKITFFRRPLAARCRDEKELEEEVYDVLWHEIGHHFGFDDRQLRRLERQTRRRTT